MAFMKTNTVNITVGGVTYNSLDDFGLAIQNTDYIGTPVRDSHITFVPGRNGPLDYTGVFGEAAFQYRPIEIIFGGIQEPDQWDEWISTFRNLFEGKEIKLEFATDPGWYYSGRCSIEDFKHKRAIGDFGLNIEYAYPFKKKDSIQIITSSMPVEVINTGIQTVPTITASSTATVNVIGKNLIPYPYHHKSRTANGVTWVVNSDGTVTANGTATANSEFVCMHHTNPTSYLQTGTYILSGSPANGSSSTYAIWIAQRDADANTWVNNGYDTGNGRTFTIINPNLPIHITLNVRSGQTVSNLVFKPMLRMATDTDATYEPYHHANKTLQAGTYTDADFTLATGKNTITSDATIIFNYTEKKL